MPIMTNSFGDHKKATKVPVLISRGNYYQLNKIVKKLGGRLEKRSADNEKCEHIDRIYALRYNYILFYGHKKNPNGTPIDWGPFWKEY